MTFGRVGSHASPTDYHVWGANASNWNLPAGQRIFGGGMASAMGVQKEGVWGIVTTPIFGPPGGGDGGGAPRSPSAPASTGGGGGGGGGGDEESYDATSLSDFRPVQLKPKEHGGFAAAGALVLRRGHGGEPEVLLGMEWSHGLKPLGGRRDYARESPMDVAVREFCEETGSKDLKEQPLRALFGKAPARRLYLAGRLGKYALYVARPKEGGAAFHNVAKNYNSMYFRVV